MLHCRSETDTCKKMEIIGNKEYNIECLDLDLPPQITNEVLPAGGEPNDLFHAIHIGDEIRDKH